jgi:hypothetical protein
MRRYISLTWSRLLPVSGLMRLGVIAFFCKVVAVGFSFIVLWCGRRRPVIRFNRTVVLFFSVRLSA